MTRQKYFVYGTLMDSEVLASLGLKVLTSEPAQIPEATLYTVDSKAFPLLVLTQDPRDYVNGLLITLEYIGDYNFTVDNVLDRYEGACGSMPLYFRHKHGDTIFYLANQGHPGISRCLTPLNHVGSDWNEFLKRSEI